MNANMVAAMHYAERGLPVFPCNPKNKAPLVDGGFRIATTDADQIKAWWTKWPSAMIGIPTGPASGIDVLDLDVDDKKGKDGFAYIPDWQTRSPIIVRTPRGGAHLWFKSNGTIYNTTDAIAHGVDTRGQGGYAIAPPSQNGAGEYRFERGNEQGLADLPPFPADLRERRSAKDEQRTPGDEPRADPALIAAALAVISNHDLGWEEWNRIGMAIWAATGGKGFVNFDQWSRKSTKYGARTTAYRWHHYSRSPPTQIGAGTLFYLANAASHGWRDEYDAKLEAEIENTNRTSAKQQQTAEGSAEPSPGPAPEPKIERPLKPRISTTPFEWVDPTKIPLRRWLYKPHYVRQFVSLTVSTGGVGKSSLLIVEALAMGAGKPLLDVHPAQELRVWYWNGEDPKDELQRRFAAAAKQFNLQPEDIGDRLFVDSGRTMPILIAEDVKRQTKIAMPVINEVIATLVECKIDVLIIDPFVSCHRVAENDNAAIERVAKGWSHVAEVANCAVMLAHHSRKTGGEGVTVDDGRGASALANAARTARTLNVMTTTEADNAEIDDGDRRLHFRSDIGKANLTRPPEQADWFRLVSVDLQNNEIGLGGDEVGVVTPWTYPAVDAPVITPATIRDAQSLIKAGGPWREDQRSQKEPWVGVPIGQALNLDLQRKPIKSAVAKIVRDWLRAGWLKQVEGQDAARKPRCYIEAGKAPEEEAVPF